jgi:hypothetical protein
MDVASWLRSLGLEQYEATFRDNKSRGTPIWWDSYAKTNLLAATLWASQTETALPATKSSEASD